MILFDDLEDDFNISVEIKKRALDAISKIKIDCPECECMEDDQYTCTTCWQQGGNGKIYVSKYLTFDDHV